MMTERRILINGARCIVCGDYLESDSGDVFVRCTCRNTWLSGGHDRIEYGPQGDGTVELLTEYADA